MSCNMQQELDITLDAQQSRLSFSLTTNRVDNTMSSRPFTHAWVNNFAHTQLGIFSVFRCSSAINRPQTDNDRQRRYTVHCRQDTETPPQFTTEDMFARPTIYRSIFCCMMCNTSFREGVLPTSQKAAFCHAHREEIRRSHRVINQFLI